MHKNNDDNNILKGNVAGETEIDKMKMPCAVVKMES